MFHAWLPFIGKITLNTALSVYLIWFVPQIFLNFKRKQPVGISLWMHGILYLGYLADLMYGFGVEMQWQYRMVTLIGLLSLSIQHYQFYRYGLPRGAQTLVYNCLSIICLVMLVYTLFALLSPYHSRAFYDRVGMIANSCWLCYMLPQIIKNHRNRSHEGLSKGFVLLAILLNVCDNTSAWALDWDYPSKIGPGIALLGNAVLLLQIAYYTKKTSLRYRPSIADKNELELLSS